MANRTSEQDVNYLKSSANANLLPTVLWEAQAAAVGGGPAGLVHIGYTPIGIVAVLFGAVLFGEAMMSTAIAEINLLSDVLWDVVGYTTADITAGSFAVASGGGVAAGGLVATLQAAGAAGYVAPKL
eukprot:XP_011678861.1 PREDICTED: interferon alpha-inducible protein 27, mitochondrial-like [Strongylocentrotus purpuratus]